MLRNTPSHTLIRGTPEARPSHVETQTHTLIRGAPGARPAHTDTQQMGKRGVISARLVSLCRAAAKKTPDFILNCQHAGKYCPKRRVLTRTFAFTVRTVAVFFVKCIVLGELFLLLASLTYYSYLNVQCLNLKTTN